MPTLRVYAKLVLCTIVLFSCNNKKEKAVSTPAMATNLDTVQVQPGENIDLSDCSSSFTKNITQQFLASSQKVSVITAKKGLKVTVDPAVLEKKDGTPVDGDIKVSIIELTTTEELFKSNAATMSNGRLLSSGGSYFIAMYCNGQELRIKKDKTMEVVFPIIKNDEMELFYGERDQADNSMNWIAAGERLNKNILPADELSFTDSNYFSGYDNYPMYTYQEEKKAKIYPTLNDKVYYYTKLMTIKQLVDTVNKNGAKLYIDTVHMWPKITTPLLAGQRIDTNYLLSVYGPEKQFILKNCKAMQEEAERKAQEKKDKQQAFDKWQPKTLAGQIQKYYSPTPLRLLGWINCDRFYQNNTPTEVELDLPITFNKGSIQYFLIYRSFNGLMNGKLECNDVGKIILGNLPLNQPVTLIAFTKNNGQLYHYKEDFVTGKNKTLKTDFKNISVEEMNTIFGKNVRI